MKDGGAAIVSVSKASGENRIFKAMTQAISSSLISNVNRSRVKRMLYIIYSGEKSPARTNELGEINEFMEDFSDDILLLWGLYPDNTLDDEIKVAIVATGFDEDDGPLSAESKDMRAELYNKYYSSSKTNKKEAVTQTSLELNETNEPEVNSADSDTDESAPGKFQQMLHKLRDILERITDE